MWPETITKGPKHSWNGSRVSKKETLIDRKQDGVMTFRDENQ